MLSVQDVPHWSSVDPGRSEAEWLGAVDWAHMPQLDATAIADAVRRVIVLAAHPDDETLALGATIADLVTAGLDVHVWLATDGEGSHGRSRVLPTSVVRDLRLAEFRDALRELGVQREPVCFGLPDGGLAAAAGPVAERLGSELADGVPTLVLAPWVADGHCDHDALGRLALEVCRGLTQSHAATFNPAPGADVDEATSGVELLFYPVWWWHWADTSLATEFPAQAVVANPSREALWRKRAAMQRYPSQTTVLGLDAGEPALLNGSVIARSERLVEVLFPAEESLLTDGIHAAGGSRSAPASALVRPPSATSSGSIGADAFDEMFDTSDDPWGVTTRWYEERRRNLILAMLPKQELGTVLDLGCSTGELTSALSPRATSIIGVDHSREALRRARQRELGNVRWVQASLPGALEQGAKSHQSQVDSPLMADGAFDTIVISEVSYFLTGSDLMTLLAHCQRLLADDGVIVIANWQRETQHIPLDGPLIDTAIAHLFTVDARYCDPDFAAMVISTSSKPGQEGQ